MEVQGKMNANNRCKYPKILCKTAINKCVFAVLVPCEIFYLSLVQRETG